MKKENPILLFDGVCNLCNGAVNFLMKRDNKKQFCYVPLQSERGKELVSKNSITLETGSVILIVENRIYLESEAVIEIARLLPLPWNWFTFFRIVPLKIRDSIFFLIAWFVSQNCAS